MQRLCVGQCLMLLVNDKGLFQLTTFVADVLQ
jgi:hypothetical protein